MKVQHPAGGVVECDPRDEAIYVSQGWEVVVEAPSKPNK